MIAQGRRHATRAPGTRRRPRPAVLLAIAALLNAGAGIALGIAVTPDDGPSVPAGPPGPPEVVAAGDLRLALPPGWRRLEPPELSWLAGREAGAARGPVVDVVFAVYSPENPTLLPDALVAENEGAVPGPSPVTIDGREALRYEGLTRGRTDVYVVPTSAGVATLACLADSSVALASGCDPAVARLRVGRAAAIPADEGAAFAIGLPTAVDALNKARAAGRRALARTRSAAARAEVARRLGAAYGEAVRRMSPLAGDAAPATAVVGLLERLQDDHVALAEASARRDPDAAREAGASIRAAEARLARALRRWRAPAGAA